MPSKELISMFRNFKEQNFEENLPFSVIGFFLSVFKS